MSTVRVRVRFQVYLFYLVCFYQAYCTPIVRYCHAYRWRLNKVSNMKIHRQFGSHCQCLMKMHEMNLPTSWSTSFCFGSVHFVHSCKSCARYIMSFKPIRNSIHFFHNIKLGLWQQQHATCSQRDASIAAVRVLISGFWFPTFFLIFTFYYFFNFSITSSV